LSGERVVRRLAAILQADVVGYSRLMGRDKQGTHAKLLYVKPPQWSRHRHTVGQGN